MNSSEPATENQSPITEPTTESPSDNSTDQPSLEQIPSAAIPYQTVQSRAFPHWVWLGGCTVVLLLSFILQTHQGTRVKLPIGDTLIPEICTMKRMWKIPCPGCGLTRSFVSLAHGDVMASLGYNPVGWILFLAMLFQFPYRSEQLRRIYQGKPEIHSTTLKMLVYVMVVALPVQWAWRMIGMYWM